MTLWRFLSDAVVQPREVPVLPAYRDLYLAGPDLSLGAIGCFLNGGIEACPALGERYENTVNLMVATTLALLTTGVVSSAIKKPESQDNSEVRPPELTPAERFKATRE